MPCRGTDTPHLTTKNTWDKIPSYWHPGCIFRQVNYFRLRNHLFSWLYTAVYKQHYILIYDFYNHLID